MKIYPHKRVSYEDMKRKFKFKIGAVSDTSKLSETLCNYTIMQFKNYLGVSACWRIGLSAVSFFAAGATQKKDAAAIPNA